MLLQRWLRSIVALIVTQPFYINNLPYLYNQLNIINFITFCNSSMIFVHIMLFKSITSMCYRLTYEKISEKMLKMKVIQNFVLINFYIIHFIDKVCWTSQILGEKSWKKCDILLFVLMHWSWAPRLRRLKQNSQQKHVTFFQEFSSRICEVQQTLSMKWII